MPDCIPPPNFPQPLDARILQALLQVSMAINSELSVYEVLGKVVEWARVLLDCTEASIVLWNPTTESFEQSASTDMGRELQSRVRRRGGASRWIVDHNQALIVPDSRQDPFTANPMLHERGILSYIGAPLSHREHCIGVLYVLSERQRRFDQGELEILGALGSMAALAVINARLVESQRQMNEQRRILMRLTAHDLANPIHNALGFLDLLSEEASELTQSHREWVEIAMRSLARAQTLVHELVRYERMVGAPVQRSEIMDLATLTQEALGQFSLDIARKGIRIAPLPLTVHAPVAGDPVLLGEVVQNLISNAVKYTPDGGKIAFALRTLPDQIVLSITDSGVGIAPEEQGSIFAPFSRAHNAHIHADGTGLGLHLAQEIAHRHGGEVRVESSPGQGSTFSLHLPRPQDGGAEEGEQGSGGAEERGDLAGVEHSGQIG